MGKPSDVTHRVRISSKQVHVLLHPHHCSMLVEQTEVASDWFVRIWVCDVNSKEAKRAKSVVEGDVDDVRIARQFR